MQCVILSRCVAESCASDLLRNFIEVTSITRCIPRISQVGSANERAAATLMLLVWKIRSSVVYHCLDFSCQRHFRSRFDRRCRLNPPTNARTAAEGPYGSGGKAPSDIGEPRLPLSMIITSFYSTGVITNVYRRAFKRAALKPDRAKLAQIKRNRHCCRAKNARGADPLREPGLLSVKPLRAESCHQLAICKHKSLQRNARLRLS